MSRTARRPASRYAARTLALAAAVPVLLVAGCSGSDEPGDDTADDQQPQTTAPAAPEPVRFAALPEPCSTVDGGTVEQIVPEAEPKSGDTLTSGDTGSSAACLWSGLNDYQFRSLTVSLRRFDSDLTLGSGDERATAYVSQMVAEITDEPANQQVDQAQLSDPGEDTASLSYRVTKEADGGDQDYRQQRVIARTGNIVVTVDYSGAGFEGADMPSAETVKENAEAAAEAAITAVEATAGDDAPQGGDQGDDQGASEGGDAGAGEEGQAGDA